MNSPAAEREKERIRRAARLLADAAKPLKVLRVIDWPPSVKEAFLAGGARELPRVEYQPIDPTRSLEAVTEARRDIHSGTTIDGWLARHADAIETTARMLAAVGTPEFFQCGRRLYGEPLAPLLAVALTPMDLAQSVRDTTSQLARLEIDVSAPCYHDAQSVADSLRTAVGVHFGDAAPRVEVVDNLSANALASASAIRVRRGARFTDCDAAQLLEHEAYIHVATALNGRAQDDLPLLASGHPGTARTQEGLAVFAEIISGAIELDRMTRLAERVFAIQMVIDGADFLELFRYFRERLGNEGQAFENARRVFRGGVITGGAPFTKDVVYLYGLMQVGNVFRGAFSMGRSDILKLLFCGKLSIDDLPALGDLAALGLLRAPRFVPPWVRDPRTLFALLTYTTFANRIDPARLAAIGEKLLGSTPVVKFT